MIAVDMAVEKDYIVVSKREEECSTNPVPLPRVSRDFKHILSYLYAGIQI